MLSAGTCKRSEVVAGELMAFLVLYKESEYLLDVICLYQSVHVSLFVSCQVERQVMKICAGEPSLALRLAARASRDSKVRRCNAINILRILPPFGLFVS